MLKFWIILNFDVDENQIYFDIFLQFWNKINITK